MKILIATIITFFLFDFAIAFCGPSKPLMGKFEIFNVTNEVIACDAPVPGKLKLAGCILTLFGVPGKADASEKIRVYGNSELCILKPKEMIEMWVGKQCCDMLGPIVCKEYPDGLFNQRPDGEIACKMNTPYYVFQYKLIRDGRTVIRIYNNEKMIFEDSDAKDFRPISKGSSKKLSK